jgi:hypothetical protein
VNSTLPTIFEWAEEHVRLFQVVSAPVAIAIGGGGFVLGWLPRHRRSLRDRQNYRNHVLDQQIAFEAHLLRETLDGSIRLEADQWAPKHAVTDFFHDAVLSRS